MNTIHAVYKILKALEKLRGEKKILALNDIRGKIGEDLFCNILKVLSDEGYITGIEIWISGEVDFEDSFITMKGLEYLHENVSMKDAASIIGTVAGKLIK